MAMMLNGFPAELLFGNIGAEIPTYVGNDNFAVVYQVDSANTVTNEKRLRNFSESNRAELEKNDWLSIGYIPERINTSDGLTRSMAGAKLKRLLNENISQIVTETQKGKLERGYPRQNITLCILKLLKEKRIWTTT